jgi:hypothetical protein
MEPSVAPPDHTLPVIADKRNSSGANQRYAVAAGKGEPGPTIGHALKPTQEELTANESLLARTVKGRRFH